MSIVPIMAAAENCYQKRATLPGKPPGQRQDNTRALKTDNLNAFGYTQ